MELMDLMRKRRSIRKYQSRQVPRPILEQILEAGVCAPNAGGGQRTVLLALRDPKQIEALGKLNVAYMDRSNLYGTHVSTEQPSIIDDPSIRSGFYGAPTVCVIFAPERFLYSIPDAFCCAENMVLEAQALGVSSCIVARGEDTFRQPFAAALAETWELPKGYIARCFVLLGYCDGPYPAPKPHRAGRIKIVE